MLKAEQFVRVNLYSKETELVSYGMLLSYNIMQKNKLLVLPISWMNLTNEIAFKKSLKKKYFFLIPFI
jgi:ABC-type proline/glycine betaine transport system substrate-binding protein